MAIDELVTIATFADLGSAQFHQSLLREYGIRSFIPDERAYFLRPTRMWNGITADIRLQVLPSDEAQALSIINQTEATAEQERVAALNQGDDIYDVEPIEDDQDDDVPAQLEEEDEIGPDGEFVPPQDMVEEELRTWPLSFWLPRFSGIRYYFKILLVIAFLAVGYNVIRYLHKILPL
jgi:hypothetical protein